MVIVVKYNIETISRGVVSHLNLDQRYKPVEFEDIIDLVTVLVRLNQPTRIDDFAFTDKVAAAITRTPKTYATETLLKKLHPIWDTRRNQKVFSLVKLYPFVITDGTMNAFCKRAHKELKQFYRVKIHVSHGPYPWIHYNADDLEEILKVLVDKKVIVSNPIYNSDYDMV